MKNSSTFIWAGGIEDTFINEPHPITGKRLDEYELIGHYEHWRDDLRLAASLGISALRWGIPWYRVEPARGDFDWRWVDEVVDFMLGELGIQPIIDLMHYGAPPWMPMAQMDKDFVTAFTDYVEAFARRYTGRIRFATPMNEPWTAAEFSGRRGDWPPYLRGDSGFVAVMLPTCRAAAEASRILTALAFTTVHVEIGSGALPAEPGLSAAAETVNLQNELYWDLLTARVTEDHPLTPWLRQNGAKDRELEWFRDHPARIDILGVNYYPQWSYQLLCDAGGPRPVGIAVNGGRFLLEKHLRRHWSKYRLPLMITETSVRGLAWEKTAWLEASTSLVTELIAEGIPIAGYTWFPLIDMIDWEYRNRAGGSEDFLVDFGLWNIERTERTCAATYRDIISR